MSDRQRRAVMAKLNPSGGARGAFSGSARYAPEIVGLERAREIHEGRSERAQVTDDVLEARITADVEKWGKAPNRWDIRGVDFFPAPTMPDDFITNVKVWAYMLEQYYNEDTSKIKIYGHKSAKSYDAAYGREKAQTEAYAFAARANGNEVHFSPRATKAIRKGRIETATDFDAMKVATHEITHCIGRTPTSKYFNEGATEILSLRFVVNSLQMDRRLRKRMREMPSIAYIDNVRYVANIALLVNDGDKERAIQWLNKFYTDSEQSKRKMEEDAEIKLLKMEPLLKNAFDAPTDPGGFLRSKTGEILARKYPSREWEYGTHWWINV